LFAYRSLIAAVPEVDLAAQAAGSMQELVGNAQKINRCLSETAAAAAALKGQAELLQQQIANVRVA